MPKEWLRLHSLDFLSTAQKRALVESFGSPQNLFAASPDQLKGCDILSAAQIQTLGQPVAASLDDEFTLLEKLDAGFIGFTDSRFPGLLNQISTPPLGLFYRGNPDLMTRQQIAIVGSRNASPSGKRTTRDFAFELGGSGLGITSGMALGVDTEAHLGCLEAGMGTIAVLGTGIDQIYPWRNRSLFARICEHGLAVSEFPLGTPPKPENFPQRNRIISGLSVGTLVVEAGLRSGSLITARLAADQGREVFAIPGSIHNPTSRGCHYLIRQGAKLTESVPDILTEIGALNRFVEAAHPYRDQDPGEIISNPLYHLIDFAPTTMDQLIEASGLTTAQVSSILLELELKGVITEINGGYQRIA